MAAPPRRFAYYDRLSAEGKRTYRRSDAISEVPLRDPASLGPPGEALREALFAGGWEPVQRAAERLVRALLADLGAGPVDVEVMEVRPRGDGGELHGLYTYEPGERPRIQVWMRTAAKGRVVAWKTFLRTLLHEVGHHLDVNWLDLDETFHTRGFYRRENHLFDQLQSVMREPPPAPRQPEPAPAASQGAKPPSRAPRGQLRIPGL